MFRALIFSLLLALVLGPVTAIPATAQQPPRGSDQETQTLKGAILELSEELLVVQTADGPVTLFLDEATVRSDALAVGQRVVVEYTDAADGKRMAVRVTREALDSLGA